VASCLKIVMRFDKKSKLFLVFKERFQSFGTNLHF